MIMKINSFILKIACIVVKIIVILPSILYGDQSKEQRLDGSGFRKEIEKAPECETGQKLLHKWSNFCKDNDYDEEDLPPNQEATSIYYKTTEMDILEINEKGKTIEIEMGLGRGWQDERIELHSLFDEPHLVEFYNKRLPLWFPTEKKRHARNMEQELETKIIGQIISDRTWVLTYSEIYLDLHCDFKFAKFPMDTQSCKFILINSGEFQLLPLANDTFGKLRKVLIRELGHHSLDEQKDAFPPFVKDGFEITTLFVHGNDLGDKNLSYWGFNMTMRRITSNYVYQYYVPAAAIVCVSQISFIIPHYSIPGRIGLLATLFLTLMNIFISHMVSMINYTSYLSQID